MAISSAKLNIKLDILEIKCINFTYLLELIFFLKTESMSVNKAVISFLNSEIIMYMLVTVISKLTPVYEITASLTTHDC